MDRFVGQPVELEPWQCRFMSEALAVDDDGAAVWSSVALVLPRKNGKTTLLSAVALYELLENEGSPEILLAAGSDKQAGRLFDQCASFIKRSPELLERVALREYVGEIARIDAPGKILRMSSKGETLHGYNPSLVVVDELHTWNTPRLAKAWTALTTAGGARSRTQVFTISTAGEESERADGILGRLVDGNEERGDVEVDAGLRVSRNSGGRTLVYAYGALTDSRHDVDALMEANPASWVKRDYIERQVASPELRDWEILQYHGNVWSSHQDMWLPPRAWEKCRDVSVEVERGAPVVLGFDGSYNGDSTALVGVMLRPDAKPHVFLVDAWERPVKAREAWVVPRDEVRKTVEHWMETYNVVELACDPPGWNDTVDAWHDRWGSPPVIAFHTNQPSKMAPASSRFYSAVVNGDLTHDGSKVLARHIGNAVVKETPNGAVIVKDGRKSPRKIDAAVAAVVAYERSSGVHSGGEVGVMWG